MLYCMLFNKENPFFSDGTPAAEKSNEGSFTFSPCRASAFLICAIKNKPASIHLLNVQFSHASVLVKTKAHSNSTVPAIIFFFKFILVNNHFLH